MTPEEKAEITRIILDDRELRRYYSGSLRFRDAVDNFVRSLPKQVKLMEEVCKEQAKAASKARHPHHIAVAVDDSDE